MQCIRGYSIGWVMIDEGKGRVGWGGAGLLR